MKAKLVIMTIVGLSACTLALAQEEPATPPPTVEQPVAAAPESGAVIPLIQFQDVPLTTAIDNLARQAGINYILDPKVGYGQPDERGQIRAQPNITIRWENLTAEQALNALITTYGLQLVPDTKTGISRVTVKDPAAAEPLHTEVIQLKFASPSNTVAAVATVLVDKRSRVIADVRTSQLVISATESEIEQAKQLIERLDTQTKQVLIEAKIMETTLSPKSNKGLDWSGTLSAQKVRFGNNMTGGRRYSHEIDFVTNSAAGGFIPVNIFGPNQPLGSPGVLWDAAQGFNPSTAFLDADGLNVALSFLNESGDTKVVSEPRMVTLDNQKATIDVGLLYPVVNVSAGTANTAGGSEISYTNLTVSLDVTPRIAANNFIELRVQQGVLRLGPTFQSIVADQINEVDSFLKRSLDTTVLIPSGNTLVMGGLIQDEKRNGSIKVPLLGDIPGLGLLFRKESKELDRQNLTIFITPTVVQDSDFRPTQTSYLQSTGEEKTTEDWSWWDSGKPAGQIKKEKHKFSN